MRAAVPCEGKCRLERPASRHGVICAFVALFLGVEVPLVVAAELLLSLAAWVM